MVSGCTFLLDTITVIGTFCESWIGGVPLYGRPIVPYNRCEQANRPKERSLSLESLILVVNDHPGRRPA